MSEWMSKTGILKKIGLGLLGVCLAGVLVFCGHWLYWRILHVSTDAAYVKADMANVAPEVPGKITAICVREGEIVRQGQILMRIDPEQMDRQVGVADADLARLLAMKQRYRAELDQVSNTVPATIAAAEAALDVARRQKIKAQASLNNWTLTYNRYRELYRKQTIGKAKYDEAETAWQAASADFSAAESQVVLSEARLQEARASRALIPKTKAANREVANGIVKAEHALKIAKINRGRCDIKAPIGGVVARLLAREGDFASPGRPVIGLYNPGTRYIEARFEETKVRYIVPGKKVRFIVDNFPDKELFGTVQAVTPASAAEFSLIPRDVSAGEFTKVVQRIPIRIAIDHLEKYPDLVPGMSCEVTIARK